MNLNSFLNALTAGGKTVLISSGLGGALLLVYSALIGDKVVYLTTGLVTVALLSALLGGLAGGMADGRVGWLHGGTVALLYLIIIQILKVLLFPSAAFTGQGLIFAAQIVVVGCAGGVLGINLRFLRRHRIKRRYLIL